VAELKVFLSRRCRSCIKVKEWFDANPFYSRFAQYQPPNSTVPALPYMLYNGKSYRKPSEIVAKLDEIKQSPKELFKE
jgi:arsenate reductase-like glutaredoxin family protein